MRVTCRLRGARYQQLEARQLLTPKHLILLAFLSCLLFYLC